jgi:anti-sigma factor RsiW
MTSDELLELMHEVLDGGASASESRKLDQLLSQDPVARAEFEDLRRLFAALNTMPKELPPEDLVSTVAARIPQSPRPSVWRSQLFSRLGVLRLSSVQARANTAGQPDKTWPVSRFETSSRNDKMSTDKGLFSKRIVWIGAGIAAVAVVVATQFFDIPSNSGVGTIVPAQRFQATQPGAGDVNASLGVGSTQVVTVVGADGDHALNDHALNDHALNDHAFNDHAINDHAINDHAINDHAINDHAINDHALNDHALNDHAINDHAINDHAINDHAINDHAAADGNASAN